MLLETVAAATLALSSPAFANDAKIPDRYTCNGADLSPPLRWTAPPAGTRSFSLEVVDVNAHGFVHWSASGIPASARAARRPARAARGRERLRQPRLGRTVPAARRRAPIRLHARRARRARQGARDGAADGSL